MANDVNAIAAKLALAYEQPEPEPVTAVKSEQYAEIPHPTQPEVEPEPIGKSSVIPSVGRSPGPLTAEQLINLAGGDETSAKHRYLSELIQKNSQF